MCQASLGCMIARNTERNSSTTGGRERNIQWKITNLYWHFLTSCMNCKQTCLVKECYKCSSSRTSVLPIVTWLVRIGVVGLVACFRVFVPCHARSRRAHSNSTDLYAWDLLSSLPHPPSPSVRRSSHFRIRIPVFSPEGYCYVAQEDYGKHCPFAHKSQPTVFLSLLSIVVGTEF